MLKKVLFIGGEQYYQSVFKQIIGSYVSLELIGKSSKIADVFSIQRKVSIDMLIIDLDLVNTSDLKALHLLPSCIFTIGLSSENARAKVAFDANLNDFILRSTIDVRFHSVFEKYSSSTIKEHVKFLKQSAFVKKNGEYINISYNDILFVSASNEYSVMYTKEARHLLHNSLSHVQKNLPSYQFCRVHRSYVVNTSNICRFDSTSLTVRNQKIPVSKTGKKVLNQMLSII